MGAHAEDWTPERAEKERLSEQLFRHGNGEHNTTEAHYPHWLVPLTPEEEAGDV